MPTSEVREWKRIAHAAARVILWVEPTGGQAVARRNARSAWVQDKRLRAQRLEAERTSGVAIVEAAVDQGARGTARQRPRETGPREMAAV